MSNIIIKGKSEKAAFTVKVPREELIEFFTMAMDAAQEEFDEELTTSPGGFSTALFTAMMGAKAREAVEWDLESEGWSKEKAWAAFSGRLERKSRKLTDEEKAEKAAKALATAQANWDAKVIEVKGMGLPEEVTNKMIALFGPRPAAKK